jgi:energy-coupling factor transporter transmembrane protein EcfT
MDDSYTKLEEVYHLLMLKVRSLKAYLLLCIVVVCVTVFWDSNVVGRSLRWVFSVLILTFVAGPIGNTFWYLADRIRDGDSSGKNQGIPNKSSEPTPASVMPPAGQESRPR